MRQTSDLLPVFDGCVTWLGTLPIDPLRPIETVAHHSVSNFITHVATRPTEAMAPDAPTRIGAVRYLQGQLGYLSEPNHAPKARSLMKTLNIDPEGIPPQRVHEHISKRLVTELGLRVQSLLRE